MKIVCLIIAALFTLTSCVQDVAPKFNPQRNPKPTVPVDPPGNDDDPEQDTPDIDLDDWTLTWADEFDYEDPELDTKWASQNGPSTHIECSRWRRNAVVSNGTLKLLNKKETTSGTDGNGKPWTQYWTSGNIWTKERFLYGYYECRYKYAAAQATNNSFWLMTQGPELKPGEEGFEIDINEGHYPNEMATNIHRWTSSGREVNPKTFAFGMKAAYNIQLETPIITNKIRLTSTHGKHFHLREFRVYNVKAGGGYPDPMLDDSAANLEGLVNHAKGATISTSGSYNATDPKNMVDGKISTSFVTQAEGTKWVEFTFPSQNTVGCVQFVNGWLSGDNYTDLISNYKIQYMSSSGLWVDISVLDVAKEYNLAENYNTYGLEWNADELIFYFNRKEVRRVPNTHCFVKCPIWVSLAIINWSGPITDAIDGTQMEVDYVRVYQKK